MENKKLQISKVSESKIKLVKSITEKIKKSKTTLIASTKNLPSKNFQEIKKLLRGKAEIFVIKKTIVERAIKNSEKGAVQNLKDQLQADIAIMFSDLDAFMLSSLLMDNQSPAKAHPGDIALEDINVEPGPTDLVPGPAISELSSVGLKVSVENGKLAIKQPATLAKKGTEINEKVANVLSKLNISPMKVGFEPLAAYDANDDKVYIGIRIDKKQTLEDLHLAISKSLGFAVNMGYFIPETRQLILGKVAREEMALSNLVSKYSQDKNQKEDA